MESFVDQMANVWADTARLDGGYDDVPQKGLVEIARDRVIALYEGEVRVSEMSKADRAVWRGRPRIERDMARIKEITNGRETGRYELVWWNYYDTTQTTPQNPDHSHWECVFDTNRNIGRIHLTNLQVAGQMDGTTTMLVELLYVTPLCDFESAPWDATAALEIGDRYATPTLPLSEWFRGIAPVNMIIPVRQRFGVRVSYGSPANGRQMRFHIEGIRSRSVY